MRNLEAKFRLASLADARRRALAIGYTYRDTLRQRDTFFRVARGKLKLREEGGKGSLIHYGRIATSSLQLSNYEIVPVADPENTRAILAAALGVVAVVRKERVLLTRANVRLHLDRVEGLGEFGELEAVVAEGDDPEDSRASIDETLTALGISADELIDVSYFELAAHASPRE